MEEEQRNLCKRYGAGFTAPEETYKVGVSDSALRGELPLHGLRHWPESGTTGWFIWACEWSDAPDFFKPLHLYHLVEDCPTVVPFLALPPGWRFMVAPGHEDVWSDSDLLDS
ncbi:immunity protein Imm33 domain-containing protein [Sphingomonas oryzagri]